MAEAKIPTGIGDLIKNGTQGLISGLGDSIAKVTKCFKADPTEAEKAQSELEQLKLNISVKMQELANQAEEFHTRALESEDKAVTERWTSDMGSDSWLSKNTRPIVMLSLLAFLFVIVICDSCNITFDVKPEYIDLLKSLLVTVVVAYFGSRGVEKLKSMHESSKITLNSK